MMGKKPPVGSALVWSGLATVALQVSVLAVLGQKPPGPVLSQALEAVMAVLAATSCLQSSFRGQAFAKSFWRLAASAFFLWGFAQTLGTYHLYFEAIRPQAGPRAIILYFFSFTPLFAILFLSPNAREQDTRWETALDFLQILIISATLYFMFLHVPWWQLSEAEWVSRRSTTVNLRNFLLSAGFILRILASPSRYQRELYTRLGAPLALYTFGFWMAKRGISLWSNHLGSWFDLGWTLSFLLIVILAEGWKEETPESEPRKVIGYVPILMAFPLTLSLPVVFLWLRVVRGPFSIPEAYLIGGSVAAVFICFCSRLFLALYR